MDSIFRPCRPTWIDPFWNYVSILRSSPDQSQKTESCNHHFPFPAIANSDRVGEWPTRFDRKQLSIKYQMARPFPFQFIQIKNE